MPRRVDDPQEYIRARVTVDANDCWNWALAKNGAGYGVCSRRDVRGSAHRFSYEVFVGSIAPGLQIDHLCRNRGCVNPRHLEAVLPRENKRRGVRAVNGRNYALYREKRGLWCASVTRLAGGIRSRKSFRAATREQAAAKADAWLAA